MSNKMERFRPKFNIDEINEITDNRSRFYNEAIIEKLDSIYVRYPGELKELKKTYEYKKERIDLRNEEIKELTKRIQILEHKNDKDVSELKKLESEIDRTSKILKHKEEIKENQDEIIEENKKEVEKFYKYVIELFFNESKDNELYTIPTWCKNLMNKEIPGVFTDWSNFKEHFSKYVKDKVNEKYECEIRLDFNKEINSEKPKYSQWIGEKQYKKLLEYIDSEYF